MIYHIHLSMLGHSFNIKSKNSYCYLAMIQNKSDYKNGTLIILYVIFACRTPCRNK